MSPTEILVVEDSPTQAEQLRHQLEAHGYVVRVAGDGEAARQALSDWLPALVITDVVMPEMDGYQLCRAIKADPALRDLPVVLLTALSDPVDVVQGLECGADNFLIKPYDEAALLSRIELLLAHRRLEEVDRLQVALQVSVGGRRFQICSTRVQILDVLMSTYEAAVQRNEELVRVQEELRQVNETLRERSVELEASMEELDAFAWSISHDLRAPLRQVRDLARALGDTLGVDLRGDALRLLELLGQSAARMGAMVEGLLRFSRTLRQPLTRQVVDPARLVGEALEDLASEREGRRVELRVGPLAPCRGDPLLLRQVFANLLSNALKFTRRRAQPRIEVGCSRPRGETVYFVRDNGAGFDPAEAGRLFGVFQRLHPEGEFPGTGVGLALVQRIVRRHGGRVWAEGAVDAGATFYFTVGDGVSAAETTFESGGGRCT